jgi:three-Cys-motif partner protein
MSRDHTRSDSSAAQTFGGPWSLIKTDMVDKYIQFFNKALRDKPFERIYIDAFAGSGAFRYVGKAPRESLFESHDRSREVHPGSALLALRVDPPFDRIFFIEKRKSNVEALQDLIAKSGHPGATVERGDANEALRELCRPEDWRRRRGVIFLDPFGMNVAWATLQMIAATRALDVWLLFPLGGTVRNLPHFASRLDAGKRTAVTRVLGTDEWFGKFYKVPRTPGTDLWGKPAPPAIARRTATVDQIEAFVGDRLRSIFAHVEPPRRLKAPGNKPLFSLFFAISNPSPTAITLARKAASHILRSA